MEPRELELTTRGPEGRVAEEAPAGGARIVAGKASGGRGARQRLSAAYERTAVTAERAYRGARDYATENPTRAAALTFVAGLGVGMILGPRRRGFPYLDGLLPVVALAAAQAVLDVLEEGR